MSKFEINCITIELIRAILRFRFSFLPPKCSQNNIQILFVISQLKIYIISHCVMEIWIIISIPSNNCRWLPHWQSPYTYGFKRYFWTKPILIKVLSLFCGSQDLQKCRLKESSETTYIIWVLFWPVLNVKQSCTV